MSDHDDDIVDMSARFLAGTVVLNEAIKYIKSTDMSPSDRVQLFTELVEALDNGVELLGEMRDYALVAAKEAYMSSKEVETLKEAFPNWEPSSIKN